MSLTITRVITGDVDDLASVTLLTLVRTDTGADVTFPVGGAFTEGADDDWSITFTEPAAGLTYAYTYRRTFDDASYLDGAGTLVDVITDPAGTYWSWLGIKNELGKDNAEIRSQLDGTTTADFARITADGNLSDVYVNRRARLGGYTVPISSSIADFPLVQRAANLYASFLLAKHRQWFDQTGPEQEKLVGLEAEAKELLDALFGPDPGGIDAEPDADSTTDPLAGLRSLTPARGKLNCCTPWQLPDLCN